MNGVLESGGLEKYLKVKGLLESENVGLENEGLTLKLRAYLKVKSSKNTWK